MLNRRRTHRLNTSLWQAFALQLALISATAVAGVFLAEFAIRELLIVSALEREADYFWARRRISADTPAPNTNTLIGYVFDSETRGIPEEFAGLAPGIHDLVTPIGAGVVHVSEYEGTRLFLVFDANNVTELATYFGLAPLALMLIVLYMSAWVAYGLTRRAVSPVIRLARLVRDIDIDAPRADRLAEEFEGESVDAEIEALAGALRALFVRVDESIDRERMFTREASHELRSPLTVIRMAGDTLTRRADLSPESRGLLDRILRAARDMEELTEVLLLLARESEGALERESVSVNQVITGELNRCRMIYADKLLTLEMEETADLRIESSARVIAILFGNLLRNACAYTDQGMVRVSIDGAGVTIADSGVGMDAKQLGQVFTAEFSPQHARGNGIGLSLVRRITDRFGWDIVIDSEPAKGTRVRVSIPRADNVARDRAAAG